MFIHKEVFIKTCKYQRLAFLILFGNDIYLSLLAHILQIFFFLIFNHLKLCLATAIHNLKWLKITHFV